MSVSEQGRTMAKQACKQLGYSEEQAQEYIDEAEKQSGPEYWRYFVDLEVLHTTQLDYMEVLDDVQIYFMEQEATKFAQQLEDSVDTYLDIVDLQEDW